MSAAAEMAVAMPAIDGSRDDAITGKRKRGEERDEKPPRDLSTSHAPSAAQTQQLNQFFGDLLEILKTCDTVPSILTYPLTASSDDLPAAKRAKVSASARSSKSIQSKIASSAYSHVNELTQDITNAAQAISESENGLAADHLLDFRSVYDKLIARQKIQEASSLFEAPETGEEENEEPEEIELDVGFTREKPTASAISFAGPGGRPYFSSLRNTTPSHTKSSEDATEDDVLEAVLPKGMWTSTVLPAPREDAQGKTDKVPTLGDICPAPSHLKPLEPPRDSPLATTRGSTVGWYTTDRFPTSRVRLGGRSSYSNQRLRGGTWLSTMNLPTRQINPLGERPKTKDLSATGTDTQAEQTEEEREKARLAKRKLERERSRATFKKVYSNFAPTFDNTGSVIPQDQRRHFWWSKKKLSRDRRLSPNAEDLDLESTMPKDVSEVVLDHALLEEAVRDFEESDADPWTNSENDSESRRTLAPADSETEAILVEISDMLETLSSYQRIRHVELKPTQSSSDSGNPSKPSSAEFDLHTMLRDQLAVLVASLPPFAVAKLDGEQLSSLNISTSLELGADFHRGILDDDTKPSGLHSSTASQRHQTNAAVRAGGFPGVAASPGVRQSYSAPRPPSGYYPGRPPVAGSTGYSTYQQHAGQAQRPPQFAQSPLAAQSTAQAEGRTTSLPNGYMAGASGSPMPGRSAQYSGAGMSSYQQRAPQAPGNYQLPRARGVTPPHAGRPAYPPTGQASPPQHSYQAYHGMPQRVSGLVNGTGANGPPISMSPEARAMLAARQAAQHQSPPVQVRAPHVTHASPSKSPGAVAQAETHVPPPTKQE